jgi:hypothetical protein
MDCCAGIGLRRGCGYRLHEEARLKARALRLRRQFFLERVHGIEGIVWRKWCAVA